MRKALFFLVLLVISLILLVSVLAVEAYLSSLARSSYQNSMQQMWDYWMSGSATQTQNAAQSYLWIVITMLTIFAIIAAVGLVYFLIFPKIKSVVKPAEIFEEKSNQFVHSASFASVLKTLSPEESKVLKVLNANGGRHLQKEIRKEAGLSRLKTHRIMMRLSERGIVTLEKTGNTNKVILADWLKQGSSNFD